LRAKQRKRNAELRSGLSSKSAEGSDDGLPKEEGEYSSSGGASEDENERKESPQPKTISKEESPVANEAPEDVRMSEKTEIPSHSGDPSNVTEDNKESGETFNIEDIPAPV